jgi:hypothetical protein
MIQEYIEKQSTNTLRSIAGDWEDFERDGHIGDCTLRNVATELMTKVSANNVTFWMREVAFSTYRELYKRTAQEASDLSWRVNYDRQGGA